MSSENYTGKVDVTEHAIDRLFERFPKLQPASRGEARRLIKVLVETGVFLSVKEMKELAFNIGAQNVSFVYSPLMTAAIPIRHEKKLIRVLTIYPAELRPQYRKLSQMLKIQALEGVS